MRALELLMILARVYPTKSVNNKFVTIFRHEGETMKNPLDSLWGTVIAGLVLTAVLFVFANNFLIGG